MQGLRSSKGPFPETMSFDDASTSDDTSINQLISFNNMHSSGHNNTLEDYLTATDDPSIMYRYFATQQGHNFNRWTMGGTSSIVSQNHNAHSVPIQVSNNDFPQDFNMSTENLEDDSDDCQILETPPVTFSSFTDPLWGQPSGSGNLLDSRRISGKRKSLERNLGQSSRGESSSNFQQSQGSAWRAVPSGHNARNNLSYSNQLQHASRISSREVAIESPFSSNLIGNSQSSIRSYHSRISPFHRVDSVPMNFPLTRTLPQVMPSSTFASFDPDPLLVQNLSPQRQSGALHVSSSRRTPNPSRLAEGTNSRHGDSSSSLERNEVPHEEPNPLTLPRNILEHHPVFMPTNDLRNSAQSSVGSSSGVQLSSPYLASHQNRPQYPRRLSELVRRSLLASADNGGAGSNSAVPSGPISSGAGNRGHRLINSRSALLLNRQRDLTTGLPHSLQGLASASEGRSRLVSEIRSVLDLMHMGENLRFEDVVLLDHSVLLGMTNMHDRHRDMRLDVDNMSYEELLALEERIGNVNTGLNEGTILNSMVQRKYFLTVMSTETEVEPCCVCQEIYNDGEDVGTLECGHEFHSHCIKQWLMHKNLCPICKTTALTK